MLVLTITSPRDQSYMMMADGLRRPQVIRKRSLPENASKWTPFLWIPFSTLLFSRVRQFQMWTDGNKSDSSPVATMSPFIFDMHIDIISCVCCV